MSKQYVAIYDGKNDKIFLSNSNKEALVDLVAILEENLEIKFEFLTEQVSITRGTNVYGFPQQIREAYSD